MTLRTVDAELRTESVEMDYDMCVVYMMPNFLEMDFSVSSSISKKCPGTCGDLRGGSSRSCSGQKDSGGIIYCN